MLWVLSRVECPRERYGTGIRDCDRSELILPHRKSMGFKKTRKEGSGVGVGVEEAGGRGMAYNQIMEGLMYAKDCELYKQEKPYEALEL